MNLAAVASEIVLKMQDERWQAQEARILAALSDAYEAGCGDKAEAYRLGFLDGEASAPCCNEACAFHEPATQPDVEACPV